MQRRFLRESTLLQIILCCVIATGVAYALAQYFSNRSLWLDEASLALNILDRSFVELLDPLDNYQVAPIGFLMTEKVFTLVLGENELALRLFPLLCFLASLPLFFILCKRLLQHSTVVPLATSIFSTTHALIYYASEVKQYSTDVLCTIILLSIATGKRNTSSRYIAICSTTGALFVWFSHISIIILCTCGLYLLYSGIHKNQKYRYLLPLFIWALSFCVYYVFLIHDHPSSMAMKKFWGNYFLPLNPFSGEFYLFLVRAAKNLYAHLLGFGTWYWIPILISVAGLVSAIMRKKYSLVFFCLAPLCIHLLISVFRLYPFSERLVLYLVPLCIVLYSVGLDASLRVVQKYIFPLPSLMLAIPALVMLALLAKNYPREREEIKEHLHYISQSIKPDEHVYVYYASKSALTFYQKNGFTRLNEEFIHGSVFRNQNHLYDSEILHLTGKVWMLFSHVYPSNTEENEEKYMIDLLLRNGGKILQKIEDTGSRCYYIDTGKAEN
ncbi:MAG TPA: hypothetical protein VI603_08785 [Saprospiraceae bacterium]|nr:hypothetical protein [Saprospiraceae bacterium]